VIIAMEVSGTFDGSLITLDYRFIATDEKNHIIDDRLANPATQSVGQKVVANATLRGLI